MERNGLRVLGVEPYPERDAKVYIGSRNEQQAGRCLREPLELGRETIRNPYVDAKAYSQLAVCPVVQADKATRAVVPPHSTRARLAEHGLREQHVGLHHNRLSVEIPRGGEIVRAPGCANLQGEASDITDLHANSRLALALGFVDEEGENQQRDQTHWDQTHRE